MLKTEISSIIIIALMFSGCSPAASKSAASSTNKNMPSSSVLNTPSASPALTNTDYGNSAENINNNGIVAQKGGWIYFHSGTTSIHRIRDDLSEKTELTVFTPYDSYGGLYFNIIGNTIYFVDYRTNLFQMQLDGSNKQKVG